MLLYSSSNLIDILYCMKPCPGCQDGFSASPVTEAHAASSINVWYFAGRFSWQRHPEKDANDIQRGMKAVLENRCDLGVLIKGTKKPSNPNCLLHKLQSRRKSCSRGLLF